MHVIGKLNAVGSRILRIFFVRVEVLCGKGRFGSFRIFDDRCHILAAHTGPKDLAVFFVELFLVADRFAFHAVHVVKDHFTEEVSAPAKASALRECFRFLHTAVPDDFVIVRAETFELHRLLDRNAFLGEAVNANDLVTVRIAEGECESTRILSGVFSGRAKS